ncbi:hypothetical protein K9M41_03825 [Candidatus Gracilibacteria bacterium]|nr:hypothetical protein [Candidatus Gracilibacteria bacterium]
MKKTLTNLFPYFVAGLVILVIIFSNSSFALDNNDEALYEESPPFVLAEIRQDIIAPACLDNYEDLPHSREHTDNNDWSLSFLPFEAWNDEPKDGWGAPIPYFENPQAKREFVMDINRDGLSDFIYTYHAFHLHNAQVINREIQECVLLNNGHGWEPVYRCYGIINVDNNTGSFYGDCAVVD